MPIEEVAEASIGETAPCYGALLGLLKLIAVDRIVEVVGEVREQVHVVVQHESGGANLRLTHRSLELCSEALASERATVARVEQPEPRHESARDRAIGDLIGGIPIGPVPHA